MTVIEKRTIRERAEDGDYDSDAYAEFIMDNCGGDRIICNGDTLVCAMEDGYLFDEFVDMLENQE